MVLTNNVLIETMTLNTRAQHWHACTAHMFSLKERQCQTTASDAAIPNTTRVLGKHIHPAHIMLQMTRYALNEKHNEYA